MAKPAVPFKTPPPSLPAPPAVSKRSAIPAFEVMRITDEIARRRAQGHDVVSLCAGEPNARPVPGAVSAAGYTGPLGTSALREAIAGHYRNWYGVEVDPGRIAVTTGSSGAFQLVFLAAFDHGDRVALASPGYPAYRNILTALGVQVIELRTELETRYQPTPEMLDAAVAEHGDLAGLILASPANPTGTMLARAELDDLVKWCRVHGTRLISDEIYHGITYPVAGHPDPRGVTSIELDPESVAINSFSKYWGMTGWRLGWAVLPEHMVTPFEALASNFALSPPAPAQELALTAFTPETYAERDAVVDGFSRARALILEAEAELHWGPAAPSDGAFYYYSDLGPQLERFSTSSAYAKALLEQADVAVVPGTDFDPPPQAEPRAEPQAAHRATHRATPSRSTESHSLTESHPVAGERTVRLSYAAGEAAVAEAIDRIIRFQQ